MARESAYPLDLAIRTERGGVGMEKPGVSRNRDEAARKRGAMPGVRMRDLIGALPGHGTVACGRKGPL